MEVMGTAAVKEAALGPGKAGAMGIVVRQHQNWAQKHQQAAPMMQEKAAARVSTSRHTVLVRRARGVGWGALAGIRMDRRGVNVGEMGKCGHLVKIPLMKTGGVYAAPDSEGDAVCPRPSHGHPGSLNRRPYDSNPQNKTSQDGAHYRVADCSWLA